MIILGFGMQGEDVIEHTNGKYRVLHVSMQEEKIHEHINAQCPLCTL